MNATERSHRKHQPESIEYTFVSPSSLEQRIRNAWKIGKLCDVCIVCADGGVRAHKLILALHSPYFDRLLQMHGNLRMNRKQQALIRLASYQKCHVVNLLRLLYGEDVRIESESAERFADLLKLCSVRGIEKKRVEIDMSELEEMIFCENDDINPAIEESDSSDSEIEEIPPCPSLGGKVARGKVVHEKAKVAANATAIPPEPRPSVGQSSELKAVEPTSHKPSGGERVKPSSAKDRAGLEAASRKAKEKSRQDAVKQDPSKRAKDEPAVQKVASRMDNSSSSSSSDDSPQNEDDVILVASDTETLDESVLQIGENTPKKQDSELQPHHLMYSLPRKPQPRVNASSRTDEIPPANSKRMEKEPANKVSSVVPLVAEKYFCSECDFLTDSPRLAEAHIWYSHKDGNEGRR
ncbi:unnamed protein product [Notodromas monacha]|uniref:BTB domain-containing protein n=1 Tax=Notodromas monacha TaxID=399045 RepID=A0A7R9BRM1_9CRUS|nr:unnamed protein product [Notodromas monacha]CAG0918898.1 unnamed protein product [Notodromas monacha]